ncbi:MAG: macro domain-containing protein [Actinomycetota bacterium]|nr:macro domain-containing protein [Actinomycetota bacterium]MDQ6946947.1 macro domain-containing protein [Actinomycetota bacterium]
MSIEVIEGDLLHVDDVDALVNAWNRNIVPWWLLVPHGVSGAIKRAGGRAPFRELAHYGAIPLGGAVTTGAGRLPYKGIIHVAGLSMAWRASEASVDAGTRAALAEARRHDFASLAFPLIGAGTGGLGPERSLDTMLGAIADGGEGLRVVVVRYRQAR